jgi:hypothetical protein
MESESTNAAKTLEPINGGIGSHGAVDSEATAAVDGYKGSLSFARICAVCVPCISIVKELEERQLIEEQAF